MLDLTRTRNLALACLAFGALLSSSASGQAAQKPTGTRVGVVYIQEAIWATNEGKKESAVLEQRFGARNAEIKTEAESIDKARAQLEAQADKLSEEARNTQAKSIADRQKVLKRKYEDFQAEVQQAQQEILVRLGEKMSALLTKYASTHDFAVILDVSDQRTSPVLWASTETNISQDLVNAYDAENPVSGAPAAKPAATTPKPVATTPKPAAPATTPKKP
jgi:Skp family chaperone for outer membrane proteins